MRGGKSLLAQKEDEVFSEVDGNPVENMNI